MNIQAEKIELAKLLLNTDNPSIIQSIKDIFKKANTSDFWDTLSLEQKQEIEEASIQIENKETTNYDEFMSKHR